MRALERSLVPEVVDPPVAFATQAQVYLELFKPRLSAMAVFSVGMGFLLGGGTPGFPLFGLLLGAWLLAGASAYLNQLQEREHDASMVRTQDRPLPSGRVSESEVLFGGLLLACTGTLISLASAPPLAAVLGLSIFLGYTLVYTPLKRRTELNTYAGAVVGALPILMGHVAARGGIDLGGALLFGILFVWQLPHFWAIAWIYRRQYSEAGFVMLSGGDSTGRITSLSALAGAILLVPLSVSPSVFGLAGPLYFVGSLALGFGFVALTLGFALRPVDTWARRVFRYSLFYLPLLLALMLLDKVGI